MEDGAPIDPPSSTNSSATVIPRDSYQVLKGDSSMNNSSCFHLLFVWITLVFQYVVHT